MNKLFLLTIVTLLWACSKSSSGEEVQPEVEQKLSFSIGIKERTDVTNLRVGKEIPIEVTEITDTHKGTDFVYVLRALGNDATRHQVLGVDYALKVKSGIGFRDVDRFEIIDTDNLPSFVIVPKVAGTFQIDFHLQKYDKINNRNVGEPIAKQVIFSAVKINFDFPAWEIRGSSTWNHSEHRRQFKFSIDDGNREYDSYLSNPLSTRRYDYVTYYDGQTKSGEFMAGHQYEFRDHIDTKKGPKKMNEMPQTLTIEITQHLHSGLKNIIRYENVPLEY